MTIGNTIRATLTTLENAQIENAQAEAEWIAANRLGTTRAGLHAAFNDAIDASICLDIDSDARRRASREPLQYILGDVEFCGCRIEVEPGVLIPRPETEWIVDFLQNTISSAPERALDIGTGSGAIAVALASHWDAANIVAIDLASAALRIARRNAKINAVTDRTTFLRGDLHTLPFLDENFDLIVSNPPYIRSADIPELDPEVRLHEPLQALDGGLDGADCYRSLADRYRSLLVPNGLFACELPGDPPDLVLDLFQANEYSDLTIHDDLSGKPRLLTGRNPA